MQWRKPITQTIAITLSMARVVCVVLFVLILASWIESYFTAYRAGAAWPLPPQGFRFGERRVADEYAGWELNAQRGEVWLMWSDIQFSLLHAHKVDYISHVTKRFNLWAPTPFNELYIQYQESGKDYWRKDTRLLFFFEIEEEKHPGYSDWFIRMPHGLIAFIFGMPVVAILVRWFEKRYRRTERHGFEV